MELPIQYKKNLTLECDSKIRKQISFSFSLTLPDKCLFSLSSNPHKPLRKLFLLVDTWYAVSHIFLWESEAKVQIAKSSNLFSLLLNENETNISKYICCCEKKFPCEFRAKQQRQKKYDLVEPQFNAKFWVAFLLIGSKLICTLGVSPSLVSRYCESYSFCGIQGP